VLNLAVICKRANFDCVTIAFIERFVGFTEVGRECSSLIAVGQKHDAPYMKTCTFVTAVVTLRCAVDSSWQ